MCHASGRDLRFRSAKSRATVRHEAKEESPGREGMLTEGTIEDGICVSGSLAVNSKHP